MFYSIVQYKYVSNPVDCSAVRRGSSFKKNQELWEKTSAENGGVLPLRALCPRALLAVTSKRKAREGAQDESDDESEDDAARVIMTAQARLLATEPLQVFGADGS